MTQPPERSDFGSMFDSESELLAPRALNRDFINADEVSGIYLRALEHPTLTREHLARAGFTDREIDNALRVFEWRGLIQRIDAVSWRVLPPDVSMPSFAARLEEHARQLRSSAQTLARIYAQAESSEENAPRSIVQLQGVTEIARAAQSVIASCESRLVAIRTDSPHTRHQIALPPGQHRFTPTNARGEMLSVRVLYDLSLLDLNGVLDVLADRMATGEEQRIGSALPFSLTASDTGIAVIDTAGADGNAVGMMLTADTSGDAAQRLFEFMWHLGRSWRGATPAATSSLSARDEKLIQLLASGASDSTIARQLKVSQRTVERRVKAYMDSVNAVTRFQAGVMAAKQGLV